MGTMKVTPELYSRGHSNFANLVQFDAAKATAPWAPAIWKAFGYVPGCFRNNRNVANYKNSVWYSLPGQCPSMDWRSKTSECRASEPGGMCPHPSGERSCTWHAEYAGEVSVEEFTGIKDYNSWCKESGHQEYVWGEDRGRGTRFWDGKHDARKCERREGRLLKLFARKYRSMPANYGDPRCTQTTP